MKEEKLSYQDLKNEFDKLKTQLEQSRENVTKFSFIIRNSKDAICILKNGTYDFVNHAYLDLFGYDSPEELKGTSVLLQLAAPERDKIEPYVLGMQQDSLSAQFETTGLRKNGEVFGMAMLIEECKLSDNLCTVITIHDSSELRKIQQNLKESDEKFTVAFYKSSIAKAITSFPEGAILDINEKFEELSGYSLSEIKNKSSFEINIWVNPSDREIFAGQLSNNMPVKNLEFQFRKKNGEIITCLLSSEIIKIKGEKHIISNIIDITDRKNAEKELKDNQLRWQFSVDGSGLGLWDWNAQTNQVFFSRQWKRMLGYEDSEIEPVLEEWDKRVHPDDKESVYADLKKHIDGLTPIYQNEHRVLCKNGEYKWILDRGKVISRAEDGQPLRIIGTHTDIDEQKRMQEAFIENTAKFRLLFEQSPLGIYIATRDGQITDGNQQLLELLGSPGLEATKQINVLKFPVLIENGYAAVFKSVSKPEGDSTLN
ncbi:MAG: PAS domain S-box protein [Bacteroidales bacterium]|nr:PAS domain S-box protein [Bacteroidales bacterium]